MLLNKPLKQLDKAPKKLKHISIDRPYWERETGTFPCEYFEGIGLPGVITYEQDVPKSCSASTYCQKGIPSCPHRLVGCGD